MTDKHVVIIGGGPAGYEAALEGAALGAKVTLVEKHKIGGTCLNYGCIPTKTLIENSKFYQKAVQGTYMGVQMHDVTLDYDQVLERKETIIENLSAGILTKLRKAKVTYVEGFGNPIDANHVEITDFNGKTDLLVCDAMIIATGSKPIIPDFEGVQSTRVLTSKSLLGLTTLPKSITIVGGGVIGMELGVLLNDFGVHVTILEYASHLLPSIDSSLGKRLKSIVSKSGIQVKLNAKVTGFKEVNEGVLTFLEDRKGVQEVLSEYALVAIGRIGSFDQMNLGVLGIRHNQRFIEVDEQLMTNVSNIYAIGDVNGRSLLAHAAYDQGRQVMEYIINGTPVINKWIPGCVFVTPEIATVGLTEEEAKIKDINYSSEKTLFSSSGKAMAMGQGTGFIKTMVDGDGHLIGCHILGAHASDIIHYAILAMEGDMTVQQLKSVIFAHPTLGELFSDNMHQYNLVP